MAIGRRLIIIGSWACAACVFLLIAVSAPAISSLVISGKQVCIPKVSIQCYESDCGEYFQRCGSEALHEVPSHKVCYQGRLLPAKRTDLHSCQFSISSNASQNSQLALGGCTTCTIDCSWPNTCACMCAADDYAPVTCLSKIYPTMSVAQCCLGNSFLEEDCVALISKWVLGWTSLRNQLKDLLMGQSLLQDLVTSLTFPSAKSLGSVCGCYPGGSCGSVCG